MGNLPEQRSAAGELAEIGPADLEGWSVTDYLNAHRDLAGSFASQRLKVGVLLWAVRQRLDEKAYAVHLAEVAAIYEAAERTLLDWRRQAEVARGLPPSSRRAAASAKRASAEVRRSGDGLSAPADAPRATKPERVAPDKVLPPPPLNPRPPKPVRPAERAPDMGAPMHEQPTLPGAEGWGWIDDLSIVDLAAAGRSRLTTLQRKVAEALRLADPSPRRLAPSSVERVGCPHPKPMRKQVGFGTICDPQAGGCGAKVS